MVYDLEFKRIESEIKKLKPRTVLIQLPDGLRPEALRIARFIESLGPEALIWGGSCYGACDLPDFKADLLIHYGHSEFKRRN